MSTDDKQKKFQIEDAYHSIRSLLSTTPLCHMTYAEALQASHSISIVRKALRDDPSFEFDKESRTLTMNMLDMYEDAFHSVIDTLWSKVANRREEITNGNP